MGVDFPSFGDDPRGIGVGEPPEMIIHCGFMVKGWWVRGSGNALSGPRVSSINDREAPSLPPLHCRQTMKWNYIGVVEGEGSSSPNYIWQSVRPARAILL